MEQIIIIMKKIRGTRLVVVIILVQVVNLGTIMIRHLLLPTITIFKELGVLATILAQ